jgi:Repeat of unknown function (DUF5907)
MALPGTRQQKNWFFDAVVPAVRLLTGNEPNQATWENFVSSAAFILNPEDAADVAQTQQGLVLKSIAADILAASDTKNIGYGTFALSVSPMQLPVVALSGGTVAVTQSNTTGALIYTLPAYLLASQGDVTITSPSSGQILQYNGTKWVNTAIYYQTIASNLTNKTQRGILNFSTTFTATDNSGANCTTITVTANGITYSLMQQTSGGNVLLGNSSGSASNISEITVSTAMSLTGGVLGIAVNGITYSLMQETSGSYVLLGNNTDVAGAIGEIALAPTLGFVSSGGAIKLGISVNGVAYANIQQTSGGVVIIGNVSGSAGNVRELAVVGFVTGISNTLQSNSLKTVNASTYQVLATDFNGLIIGITYTATGAVAITMCNPSTVTPGLLLRIVDTGGGAGTHNITISPYASEKIIGASTNVISSNYGHVTLFTDGTSWFLA